MNIKGFTFTIPNFMIYKYIAASIFTSKTNPSWQNTKPQLTYSTPAYDAFD